MIKPKEIQMFPSSQIGILWEDSHESIYTPLLLRKACPCALCTEHSPRGWSLHPSRFVIQRTRPVGNYALGIEWADGHDTGIYPYDYLRGLCECALCKEGGHLRPH